MSGRACRPVCTKRQCAHLRARMSGKKWRNAMTPKAPLAAVLALFCFGTTTAAQDWPNRPITLIVPFAAGGGIDTTARVQALALSEVLGQSVIVENIGAAGGTVGSARVAKSPTCAPASSSPSRRSDRRRPDGCRRLQPTARQRHALLDHRGPRRQCQDLPGRAGPHRVPDSAWKSVARARRPSSATWATRRRPSSFRWVKARTKPTRSSSHRRLWRLYGVPPGVYTIGEPAWLLEHRPWTSSSPSSR